MIDRRAALLVLVLAGTISAPMMAQQDRRISPLITGPAATEAAFARTPIEFYCQNSASEAATKNRQDLATGRSAVVRSPSPFFNSEFIRIELDIATTTCQGDCRDAVSQALIKSLALWRSGCGRCGSEKLIAVSVNDSVWVDSVTIDRWLHALATGANTAKVDPKAVGRMSLRPFGRQPVVDFRRVRPGGEKDLCSAARRFGASTDLATAVCTGNASRCASPSCLLMPVRIGRSRTCELLGRIACGSPDGEIALNTKDFAYTYALERNARSTNVTFGEGTHTLNLLPILVHETGHWFGLDHEREATAVTPASVMRGEHDGKTPWCVTEWNLTQVDNAVDMNWDFRLIGTHGLVFRP